MTMHDPSQDGDEPGRRMPANYDISSTPSLVEAWSAKRLPFEPKGWLRELRTEIGEAVRQLKVTDGDLLHAVYGSDLRDPCDVENVLLYNVGLGCFREAGRNGIRIERAFKASVPPEPLAGDQIHHWRYAVGPAEASFQTWARGRTLANWTEVPCPPLRETKVAAVWRALKVASVVVDGHRAQSTRAFGVRVVVGVPPRCPRCPGQADQAGPRRCHCGVSRA